VFSFLYDDGELLVAELILGREVHCALIKLEVDLTSPVHVGVICCSLGCHILLMSEKTGGEGIVAALADVGEGPLSESTVHITELTVEGGQEWSGRPFLCRVSDTRALLRSLKYDKMWYCDLAAAPRP